MYKISTGSNFVADWANEFAEVLDVLFSEDGQCGFVGKHTGTGVQSIHSRVVDIQITEARADVHVDLAVISVPRGAAGSQTAPLSATDITAIKNTLKELGLEEHTMLNLALQEARDSFVYVSKMKDTGTPIVITNGYTHKAFLSKCVLATKLLTETEPALLKMYSDLLKDGVNHTVSWYLEHFKSKIPHVFEDLEERRDKARAARYLKNLNTVVEGYDASRNEVLLANINGYKNMVKDKEQALLITLADLQRAEKQLHSIMLDPGESEMKLLVDYITANRMDTIHNLRIVNQRGSSPTLEFVVVTPFVIDKEDISTAISAARANNTDLYGRRKHAPYGTTNIIEAIANKRYAVYGSANFRLYLGKPQLEHTNIDTKISINALRHGDNQLKCANQPMPVCISNPHIYQYNCWSEAKAQATKAFKENNLIVTMEYLIQATQDLNAFDTIVMGTFVGLLNDTFTANYAVVYDNTTNEWLTTKDAAERLAKEREAQAEAKVEAEIKPETEPVTETVPTEELTEEDNEERRG